MWVYFLFIKFSMFYYFNNVVFNAAYPIMRFFNVALFMSYFLLASNVLFLGDIVFYVVLSYFYTFFSIIPFLMLH